MSLLTSSLDNLNKNTAAATARGRAGLTAVKQAAAAAKAEYSPPPAAIVPLTGITRQEPIYSPPPPVPSPAAILVRSPTSGGVSSADAIRSRVAVAAAAASPRPPIVVPPPAPTLKTQSQGAPVSILSSLGNIASGLIGGGNKIAQGIQTVGNITTALRPGSTVPTGPMPLQPMGAGALAGKVAGPLGGLIGAASGLFGGSSIGAAIGQYAGGAAAAGGCGCNGSGRDPCTRQRASSQPAPLATFFGGCCPPGRTLRRVNNGRDVCIKTPRMNVFNPRALARADRRVTGFARRAAPILKDMGYTVGRTRSVSLGKKKKRARR